MQDGKQSRIWINAVTPASNSSLTIPQALTQRQIKSWSVFDRSNIDWKWVTYLRGGAQWRGKAGLFTPSLSGWASHPHDLHGCLCRRDAVFLLSHLSLLSCHPALSPLCCCCCCYPEPKRVEGAVWHLRGRTGWVTYQLWCQAHMAGTSLARAITWEPVIDMRPHSQRLASPWGRGTRHLSPSWKRKWNKEWMAQKKRHWIQTASVSLHLWEKNGVNLI